MEVEDEGVLKVMIEGTGLKMIAGASTVRLWAPEVIKKLSETGPSQR
jgi:hypothetical protein